MEGFFRGSTQVQRGSPVRDLTRVPKGRGNVTWKSLDGRCRVGGKCARFKMILAWDVHPCKVSFYFAIFIFLFSKIETCRGTNVVDHMEIMH